MQPPFARHIPVTGTFNVRDLGGYGTSSGSTTPWRRLLRADSLHRLDEDGVGHLLEEGVRAVIDLRHDRELASAPNPFRGRSDVRYVNVNLLADLMPSGDAMVQPDRDVLLDLYIRALDERASAIGEVLEAISEQDEGAVLFHCAAGKDRTGIIAALLLSLAGVNRSEILDDYELTATYLAPAIPDIERRAIEQGQDLVSLRAMLHSRRETMDAMLAHIDRAHGGAVSYVSGAGLSAASVGRLQHRLGGGKDAQAQTLSDVPAQQSHA